MKVKFNTDDVTVYIAGAGSGKTTALMGELSTMLKTYRPNEIAFTTFTRKGVQTGIERALAINRNFTPDDLLFFQTLHKMAFKESGLTRRNIIEHKDIMHFNSIMGFNLRLTPAFDNQTLDDKMLQRYDAERSKAKSGIYIHSIYDEERYHRLITSYEKFKQKNNLVDFYDCLIRYLEVGKPLPIAAFLLDEAQDVTPLQWEVIMLASRNAEKVRIGGDPSQAIFSYQGAVPKMLIKLSEQYNRVELTKTYRLPKKICHVADAILGLMQEKIPRTHRSVKKGDGYVGEIADREFLVRAIKKDFEEHGHTGYRWFLLFRNNSHIEGIAQMLERLLLPYHTAKGFVIAERELNKIQRYYKYREVGYGADDVKEKFRLEHSIVVFNDDFTDSALIPTKRKYLYADYIEKYGISALIEMAKSQPFCTVTTTYKVKGGEADNVAVFLDATKQVGENIMIDLDGELRVFYVACTRAREKLFIVQPVTAYNLTTLWEAVVDSLPEKIF